MEKENEKQENGEPKKKRMMMTWWKSMRYCDEVESGSRLARRQMKEDVKVTSHV